MSGFLPGSASMTTSLRMPCGECRGGYPALRRLGLQEVLEEPRCRPTSAAPRASRPEQMTTRVIMRILLG